MATVVALLLAAPHFPDGAGLLYGGGGDRSDETSTQPQKRWMRIERGLGEREMLWLEAGGQIEYIHHADRTVLEHRIGLMPAGRFRQLLDLIEAGGLTERHAIPDHLSISGSDPEGASGYSIAISGSDPTQSLKWEPNAGTSGSVPSIVDDLFTLSAGLKESGHYGQFVLSGAPVAGRPAGLLEPEATSTGDDPSVLEASLPGIRQSLLMHPGRFLFLGSDTRARDLQRLPIDRDGGRWVRDGEHWRPLLFFVREPSE